MENIMIDDAVVAYAAPAYLCVATTDLEVFKRAVTLRVAQGELRPQAGWASSRQLTPMAQHSSPRFGFDATSTEMGGARNFKPGIFSSRNGSQAIRGTG